MTTYTIITVYEGYFRNAYISDALTFVSMCLSHGIFMKIITIRCTYEILDDVNIQDWFAEITRK